MNEEQTLVEMLNSDLALTLPDKISLDQIKLRLAMQVKEWIESDFQRLVNLLYRVDVNENKLRAILDDNSGEQADQIIAGLIIERQLEKIKTRKGRNKSDQPMNEEEW